MTVKELIEELRNYDDNYAVVSALYPEDPESRMYSVNLVVKRAGDPIVAIGSHTDPLRAKE